MATAVSLKSESSDHYIFAMDTSDQLTIDKFCEGVCKEWWAGERLDVVESTSDQFDQRELKRAVSDALELVEEG